MNYLGLRARLLPDAVRCPFEANWDFDTCTSHKVTDTD